MFYLHPALFPSMSLRLFAALLRMLMKQLFRRSAGAALWLAWGVSCSRLCRPRFMVARAYPPACLCRR